MKSFLLKAVLIIVFCIFLVSCISKEKKCLIDKDCVGASCCHAKEAINKTYAPDCRGQLCTMECVEGTTDCGQGEIKCVSGECKAVLR